MPRRDKKTEDDVEKVEIVNSSGLRWQPIARSLREIDEEKIKEAKEDVDTLLVFSGLFSAVLSAFLIETYQRLLPDKEDQIISLLTVIANQNYTVSPGFSNVTSTVFSSEPFEVPEWAVRVNVLWFSSLIVSLATASLGMLVKSWLREYLALDTEAPRKRLRVRYYREPSMKSWKVYEIVYLLPLLLQLALGLFFIGLCFFTAFVERRIGLASLPLVLAWAFFLVLTSIGPIVSPRCPFKVYALKTVLKWGRHAVSFVRSALKSATRMVKTAQSPLTVEGTEKHANDEEDQVVESEEHDIKVLVDADLVMADDSLLDSMGEVLKQSHEKTPHDIVKIVSTLIGHRINGSQHSVESFGPSVHNDGNSISSPQLLSSVTAADPAINPRTHNASEQREGDYQKEVNLPDLRMLSKRAYLSLMDILANTVTRFYNSTTNFEDISNNPMITSPHEHVSPIVTSMALAASRSGENLNTASTSWRQTAARLLLSSSIYARSIEFDDNLVVSLCTTIDESCPKKQEFWPPEIIVQSVLRIINRRLLVPANEALHINQLPHLGSMSARAYQALMNTTASVVLKLDTEKGTDMQWMNIARTVLLAHTNDRHSIGKIVDEKLIQKICISLEKSRGSLDAGVIVQSLRRLIEHALGQHLDELKDRTTMPDLSSLSTSAYDSLMKTTVLTLDMGGHEPLPADVWRAEAAILLVSDRNSRTAYYTTMTRDFGEPNIQKLCAAVQSANLHSSLCIKFAINLFRYFFDVSIDSDNQDLGSELDLRKIPLQIYDQLVDTVIYAFSKSDKVPSELLVNGCNFLFSKSPNLNDNEHLIEIKSDIIVNICHAVQMEEYKADSIVRFVLIIIRRRLGKEQVLQEGLDALLDLSLFDESEYSSIMTLLSCTLKEHYDGSLESNSDLWVRNVAVLLISPCNEKYSAPSEAISALRQLIDDSFSGEYAGGVLGDLIAPEPPSSPKPFYPLESRLSRIFYTDGKSDLKVPLEGTLRMYRNILAQMTRSPGLSIFSRSLQDLLMEKDNSRLFTDPDTRSVIADALNLICPLLRDDFANSSTPDARREGAMSAFMVVIRIGKTMDRFDDALNVFSSAWRSEGGRDLAWASYASCDSDFRGPADLVKDIAQNVFKNAKSGARRTMIINSRKVALSAAEDEFAYGHLRAIQFLELHFQLYQSRVRDATTKKSGDISASKDDASQSTEPTVSHWSQLWEQIASAIEKYLEVHYPDWEDGELGDPINVEDEDVKENDQRIAEKLHKEIVAFDSVKGGRRDPDGCLFPTTLIDSLSKFISSAGSPSTPPLAEQSSSDAGLAMHDTPQQGDTLSEDSEHMSGASAQIEDNMSETDTYVPGMAC